MRNSFKLWPKGIILFFACVIVLCGCEKKVQNAPDRYNYQRAMEALEENNTEEAIEFCEKDLAENPKDARTLSLLATAYHIMDEDGKALEILDKAVNLWSGKAGEGVVNPFYLRANVLLGLKDTVKALEDFERALHVTDIRKNIRADQLEVFCAKNDNEKVKEIAGKAIKENPNYSTPYYYLGLVALKEENWTKAIEYSDMIAKLGKEELGSAYYLCAHASIGMKDYENAAKNIMELLPTEDWHNSGWALMLAMSDSTEQFEAMKARLEIQQDKEPNEPLWLYNLGALHEQRRMFASAIDYYKESSELDADATTYERVMQCYSSMGDFKNALRYADEALKIDSFKLNVLRVKSELLMLEGRTRESLKCADELVALDTENSAVYEIRGDLFKYAGLLDEALKDYGKSLALEPDNSYVRLQRGKILMGKGQKDKAAADFKRVLKTDSVPNDESLAHHAYYCLNDFKKAKKFLAQVLKVNDTEETYYDAACLYSLMNDSVIAMKYLGKAMSKGYRQFRHIAMDSDLDNIRNMESFKVLMNEYMQKGEEKETSMKNEDGINKVTAEVPFTKEGGVCKVKCKINGLSLHFIFDTGASDVTLSQVEANFMLKNGYLSKKDIAGSQHYMDANGNISVGTVVRINNVNFGGVDLNNIRASVVNNQKAPLLLGQSVLSKLGRVEIDNKKNVIRINK